MPETGNNISLKRKFIDVSFQEEIPEIYDLYLFISPDEFSIVAAEKAGKKFIALESWDLIGEELSYALLLEEIGKESQLLVPAAYRKVICCSGFQNSTLVPNPLFEPGTAADQLSFSNHQKEKEHLFIDDLQQLEARNIFTISEHVYKTLSDWFQSVEFHHTSTALIECLLTVNRNSKEELMTANVHHSCLEIIVTKSRQLILYNRFNYSTPEELVYFLLFICEQLHLNPDHLNLQFAGEITAADSAYLLAMKYIRNTGTAMRPEIYSYCSGLREFPAQFHFNLYSQVICGS